MSNNVARSFYRCSACGKTFTNLKSTQNHMRLAHPGVPSGLGTGVIPIPLPPHEQAPTTGLVIKPKGTAATPEEPKPAAPETKKEPKPEAKPKSRFQPKPAVTEDTMKDSNGITEETGQKMCKGIECLQKSTDDMKTVMEQFVKMQLKAQEAMAVPAQPAVPPANAPVHPTAAEAKPGTDSTPRGNHSEESVRKTETSIDEMVRCPDGVCNKVLARKVLYHWDTLFPNLAVRKRDGSPQETGDPTKKPAEQPAAPAPAPAPATPAAPTITPVGTPTSTTPPVAAVAAAVTAAPAEPETDEDEDDEDPWESEFKEDADEEESEDEPAKA